MEIRKLKDDFFNRDWKTRTKSDEIAAELEYAIGNNKCNCSADIKKIVDYLEGENDGPDWHWIVELDNGKFCHIWGGCDYTGWDCQSYLDREEFNSIPELIANLPIDDHYNRNIQEHFKALFIKESLNEMLKDE